MIALLLTLGAAADSLNDALNHLAEEVHRGYVRQGLVWPQTPPYLERLFATVAGLYPDTPLEFHVLRLPDGNASALPDGRIYLREGFLHRIGSAEEAVFVLAHEAAHVALAHVAERGSDEPRRELYSVEIEIEADREALERMRAAEIDTALVGDFLGGLAGDDPESEIAVRVARIGAGARTEAAPLPVPLAALHARAVELLLERDRNSTVAEYLAARGDALEPARRSFLEGELARRERRLSTAESRFRRAISAAPDSIAAWRGLALTLEEARRPEEARTAWRRVMALDPDAPDRPLIAAFADSDCPPGAAAGRTAGGQPARFGDWQAHLPVPWRIASSGPAGLVASPDSVDLTRLRVDPVDSPGDCAVSPALIERVLRRLRARPGLPALKLDTVTTGIRGAMARLSYRDEAGIDWRLDLFAVGGPDGGFSAAYRAPARYYYPRWAADAAAIVGGVEPQPRGAAGGRGTR